MRQSRRTAFQIWLIPLLLDQSSVKKIIQHSNRLKRRILLRCLPRKRTAFSHSQQMKGLTTSSSTNTPWDTSNRQTGSSQKTKETKTVYCNRTFPRIKSWPNWTTVLFTALVLLHARPPLKQQTLMQLPITTPTIAIFNTEGVVVRL